MSGTAEDVLRVARGEIGTTSGRKYVEYFGDEWVGQAWCVYFVRYCYAVAGVPFPWPYNVAWDERDVPKASRVSKDELKPAEALSFDWPDEKGVQDGKGDHVGIVESVTADGKWTIEGNTSGGVVARKFRPNSQIICGIQPVFAGSKWVQADDGRWWYRHADGSYTTSGWELIDGEWYWFDAKGWMYVGWLEYKGHWYYLSGWHDGLYGHMVHDGIFADASTGKCYAFDSEGRMLTKGGSFKVDASGALHI